MKTFWVTFGFGSPFAKVLLEIQAPTEMELREALHKSTKLWCSIFDIEAYAKSYAEKHGITIIKSHVDATCLGE